MTLIKVNKRRFKSSKSVTEQDFSKRLPDQPIVVPEDKIDLIGDVISPAVAAGTVMGSAAIGGLIGVLALAGGPIGVVGIPIGIFGGMIVGAIVVAHRNSRQEQ